MHSRITTLTAGLLLAAASTGAVAQDMDHSAHQAALGGKLPTLAGQDAYGAIAEIVRILEADSTTDWSRVNLDRLRNHLISMNEVTLNASVVQSPVPGGLRMEVTGSGRTLAAIRSMIGSHSAELNRMSMWRAKVEDLPNGARLTLVAADAADAKLVARIRGLGFVGLLTVGNHHSSHHLALARGVALAGH